MSGKKRDFRWRIWRVDGAIARQCRLRNEVREAGDRRNREYQRRFYELHVFQGYGNKFRIAPARCGAEVRDRTVIVALTVITMVSMVLMSHGRFRVIDSKT